MSKLDAPHVTICIPSFNRAHLISETLDSLLQQTLPEWEAIVVDDGSSDNSVELIQEYSRRDSRIILMKRAREPKGACACRNIAVTNARGRYVLFLDTDDLLAPFCLEQRVDVMKANPDAEFAIFAMLLFTGSHTTANRLWNIDTGEDDLQRLLRMDPVCQGTGTLWRRDAFVNLGMWNETLSIWQDIELHLRAFCLNGHYVKRLDLPPDVFLRETESSLSRGSYYSREKLESRAAVVRQAVALLRVTERTEMLRQVRFLCASVVLGAAASGNLDIARQVRKWGVTEGVLTAVEARRLRVAEVCRASRLDRIGLVRVLRDRVSEVFSVTSTLGQVSVGPGL